VFVAPNDPPFLSYLNSIIRWDIPAFLALLILKTRFSSGQSGCAFSRDAWSHSRAFPAFLSQRWPRSAPRQARIPGRRRYRRA
jgi:hypothetical protein